MSFLNNLVGSFRIVIQLTSAGTGDANADNWEGDSLESVLESLAISSLVVESCFDCSRQGDFLVDDSGLKGEPFLFRYFFRRGDNLVDDSGVKGAPFFRYLFGSFDDFLLYPIMSQRSRVFYQFIISVIIIIFVLFLYPAILK